VEKALYLVKGLIKVPEKFSKVDRFFVPHSNSEAPERKAPALFLTVF
jgi:hypothetical protein